MPIYTFKNKETGETEEHWMSISELDKFEKKNKHLELVISAAGIGDPWKVGSHTKPNDGFREVLRSIKKRFKGSTINTY
jgi:hypothetical protein